jgi:hypothetical protein
MNGGSAMNDIAFIQSLEIARDDRLQAFRAVGRLELDEVRRNAAGEQAPPDPVIDTMRAAVNAGSILSFVSGVRANEKSDVLYSTQFAQRAANARHNRYSAARHWYEMYVDVLERLGWAGEGMAFSNRSKESGEFDMDKVALELLMDIATASQLALLVKVIDKLKSLGGKSAAIRIFEMQAMAEQNGNFQLGAVQRSENGALSMAMGAFHFKASDNRHGFLFVKWGAREMEFWAGVQKMTLNQEQFGRLRKVVIEKLGLEAMDYIAELEIA